MTRAVCIKLILAAAPFALAADWPQWLGPDRNGVSSERVTSELPADGPRVVWKHKVGDGWASPVVVGDGVIVFHRVDNREVVERLDAKTGEPRWTFGYPTDYVDSFGFDPGPRSTPTVHGDRLYTYGAAGTLHCIDPATGKPLWSVDTAKVYGSDAGFFGRACSPLVDDDRVMLNIGGRDGAGIVALDAHTGKLLWKATDDEAGYASPIFATSGAADVAGGKPPRTVAVFFTRAGLVVIDPPTGRVRMTMPFRSRMNASVNAATPLVAGDRVLLSASYGVGAALVDITGDTPRVTWKSDDAISAHYATPVRRGDFVFGYHGRQEQGPELRCVELATGKVRWSQPSGPAGSVLVADDQLVVLTERGELLIAPASPDGFKPTARAQILGFDTRAYPALAGGMLYARDKRQLICVDLRPAP